MRRTHEIGVKKSTVENQLDGLVYDEDQAASLHDDVRSCSDQGWYEPLEASLHLTSADEHVECESGQIFKAE